MKNMISRRQLNEKQVVPNLDIGHEADEELSISPNGPRNDSDIESNIDVIGQTEKPVPDNEEIYFSPDPGVTHPEISPVKNPQEVPDPQVFIPTNFETTTAFPVTNGLRNTHTVHHVTFSPNEITLGGNTNNDHSDSEHHSNHLTIYNHHNINNNNNTIKELPLPATVQLPLLRISNGINVSLQHSDTEDEEDELGKRLRSAFNVQLQHQQQHQASTSPLHSQTTQGPSCSGPSGSFNNNDNEFTFSDCNIQVNLRNSSVKPATALINKISTLTASNSFGGSGGVTSVGNGGILRNSNPPPAMNSTHPQYYQGYHPPPESSSEDDESVWYEYGCV